ncbi:MAG: Transposase [Lactobacillus delbrueckii]
MLKEVHQLRKHTAKETLFSFESISSHLYVEN